MAEPFRNDKFPVRLADGHEVESVYYGSGTLCISSQAGCAVGCPFCASGKSGLLRNLSVEEMQLQVDEAGRRGHRPRRITLSGIGEPLHNPAAVARFITLSATEGLPVSLTTTGHPLARLEEFLHLPHNGLMLSLHAGSSALHRRLVPHGADFEELWAVLERHWPLLSRRRRRKLGVNFLLLAGVNDGSAELQTLAERLRTFPELTLHLLTCNPVPASPFASPPDEAVAEIHARLAGQGINVRRPNPWRVRLEGGCGTLLLRRGARP
ncbi:radical SAM protein [Desulfuromonas versatilis]|uniref:Radical SAM protein n=1 Tax=Desulfuromonas versatilis TaxID=2802975 RepID=A0ABM8HV40_9BACT|nr:radical SAM protein [Desulfuromonas versatilis]BCR04581.1 radical SAM protein [Desulfuromonas versatilis]